MNIKDDCKWRYCVVGNIVRTRIDAKRGPALRDRRLPRRDKGLSIMLTIAEGRPVNRPEAILIRPADAAGRKQAGPAAGQGTDS